MLQDSYFSEFYAKSYPTYGNYVLGLGYPDFGKSVTVFLRLIFLSPEKCTLSPPLISPLAHPFAPLVAKTRQKYVGLTSKSHPKS